MLVLQEFLTHSVIYWEDDEAEEGEASRPNIAWPQLTWVDMSENSITELPEAMVSLSKVQGVYSVVYLQYSISTVQYIYTTVYLQCSIFTIQYLVSGYTVL